MPTAALAHKSDETILKDLLGRLQQRLQPQFDLPLKCYYCSYLDWPGPAHRPSWNQDALKLLPDPFYYIAAFRPRKLDCLKHWIMWLTEPWLLTDGDQLMIFSIHPGLYGWPNNRREINCHIYLPEIAFIVEQELKWYAEQVNATSINCSGLPGSKNHLASCFNL
ncbi:MAG: hypothetical protein ACOYUZ_03485 [Patescibacteria group bacterium]